jgi:hypothetical protein
MKIQGVRLQGTKLIPSGAAAVESDTYFNLVTLLLPGTGTNGAQNNTFVDSSTNNFTVTRNGNTTQGTFSPFSQTGWSNYFDGTGDYLSGPTNNAVSTFTGNFTIEGWFYFNSIAADCTIAVCLEQGPPETGWSFRWRQAGNAFRFYSSSVGTYDFSYIPAVGTWNHVAITRSGTDIRCFVNGNQIGITQTASGTIVRSTTNPLTIGGGPYAATSTNGYLSNVRIVNGTAVYTANFTVPTTPLTNIANTQLLTCQSNRFVDNSANAFVITVAGNVSVQAFAPFDPTTAYSAGTVGGSGYFDGTGDSLSVAQNSAFNFGTGAFSVEGWFYVNAFTTINRMIGLGLGASGGGSPRYTGWSVTYTSTSIVFYRFDGSEVSRSASVTLTAGQWYHYVACRDSSANFALFLNGTRVLSQASATTSYNNVNSEALEIAKIEAGSPVNTYYSNAYFSNIRIVAGSTAYDPTQSTLTVPTAPVTAIANTSLLLNYTNGGIIDATAKNVLETVGSAQISTLQSKFGGSSMLFDGNGDYLQMTSPSRLLINWWSQDFTIEGWIYPTTLTNTSYNQGGNQTPTLIGNMSPSTDGNYWSFGPITNGTLRLYYYNGSSIFPATSTETVTINQWNHIAVTNVAGVGFKYWVNGICSSNITVSGTPLAGSEIPLLIGWKYYSTGSAGFTGYINDLRITKGVARYTSNFTPPTQAFPTQ